MNLKSWQVAFSQALRGADPLALPGDGAADFEARFDSYRNNAWQFFAVALEQTYPVLQRRVGEEFFRRLVREYRDVHPSRRGDLHWAGADFPGWLEQRMAGSGYEWLADLARLEWACAESTVAARHSPITVDTLAGYSPGLLADLRLVLQPSLRQVASPFPIWSVWQANQDDTTSAPIDLGLGHEYCVIACVDERPVVYRIDAAKFRLVERLRSGDTLSAALAATDVDTEVLGQVLAWVFAEQLVVEILSPSAPA